MDVDLLTAKCIQFKCMKAIAECDMESFRETGYWIIHSYKDLEGFIDGYNFKYHKKIQLNDEQQLFWRMILQ